MAVLFSSCSRGSGQDEVIRTRYYHPYGPEITAASWNEKGMTGEVVEHYKSGIEVRKTYVDGKLHGTSSWSYPNSSVAQRYEEYEAGELISFGVNYENGCPEFQEELYPKDVRILKAWYEDGSPRFIEEWNGSSFLAEAKYFTDAGDVESQIQAGNGVRIDRLRNGVIQFREQYLNGQVALREEFYPNGTTKYAVSMKDGHKNGVAHSYQETGQPVTIEQWNNDLLDGVQIYFDHGVQVAQVPYKQGVREGIELRFRPGTEQVVAKVSWHNDMRHGASVFIFPDQEITEWFWKDGKVSEEQFYIRQRQADLAAKR